MLHWPKEREGWFIADHEYNYLAHFPRLLTVAERYLDTIIINIVFLFRFVYLVVYLPCLRKKGKKKCHLCVSNTQSWMNELKPAHNSLYLYSILVYLVVQSLYLNFHPPPPPLPTVMWNCLSRPQGIIFSCFHIPLGYIGKQEVFGDCFWHHLRHF